MAMMIVAMVKMKIYLVPVTFVHESLVPESLVPSECMSYGCLDSSYNYCLSPLLHSTARLYVTAPLRNSGPLRRLTVPLHGGFTLVCFL